MFALRLPHHRRTAAGESVVPVAVREFGCPESFPAQVRDCPSASPDEHLKERRVARQARLPPVAHRKADFRSLAQVVQVVAAQRSAVVAAAVAVLQKAPCSVSAELAHSDSVSPLDESA
jgi:hypothetical protein